MRLAGSTILPCRAASVCLRLGPLFLPNFFCGCKLHSQRPIDVIHAHAALPCGHAAMLLARELGIPFVVSVHGLDAFSTHQVTGWSGEWCRRASCRVYGAARSVICISNEVRKRVEEGLGGDCRTSVVYNGVDARRFSPAPIPAGKPRTILSVGNLIPIKGHELLLRSFASIRDRCPDAVCDIIGEGPERERLETLAAELAIADCVRFLGRRNRDQVADAMRACTLFVLPSRYEGLGCVYLEAMSSAKPVIACRGQGIQEIIRHGNNGWLVGESAEGELAAAMLHLLDAPDLCARMGQAARLTILQGHTLEHQADQLTQLYREASA